MKRQVGYDFGTLTEEQLVEARRYSTEIHWSDEDRVFIAEVPELPGVKTHGETREEAVEMVAEAAALWLSSARRRGWKIPEPQVASVA